MATRRFSIARVIMVLSALLALGALAVLGVSAYVFVFHLKEMNMEDASMTKRICAIYGCLAGLFAGCSIFLYLKLYPRKSRQRGFDVIQ